MVVLRARSASALNTGCIAVDFSPYQQSPEMLSRLFAGKSIPAEIRVRWIPNGSKYYDDLITIKKTWCCLGPAGDKDSVEEVGTSLDAVVDEAGAPATDDYQVLVKLVERIKRKWDCNMNLYSHNCMHFSAFVMRLARNDEVCEIL